MDEDDLGATVDPAATPYLIDQLTDGLRQELGLNRPGAPREAPPSGAVIPLDRRPPAVAQAPVNASAGAGA